MKTLESILSSAETAAQTATGPARYDLLNIAAMCREEIAKQAAPSVGAPLFPLIREAHYLHGAGKRFMLVATDEATAREVERACNSHADFVAIIDKVSRYLTGDCRAGDLSELESIICDIEHVRATHGLDRAVLKSATA